MVINGVMPDKIVITALARHTGTDDLANFREITTLALPWSRPIAHGAATAVLFAANPHVDGATGRYDEDCAEAKQMTECDTHSGGVAPYAPNRPMPRALQQTFANLTRLRPERPGPTAAARSPWVPRDDPQPHRAAHPRLAEVVSVESVVSAVATSREAPGIGL